MHLDYICPVSRRSKTGDLRQNFSSASRAALYEKLRTVKAQLRRERQEKQEMKAGRWQVSVASSREKSLCAGSANARL